MDSSNSVRYYYETIEKKIQISEIIGSNMGGIMVDSCGFENVWSKFIAEKLLSSDYFELKGS